MVWRRNDGTRYDSTTRLEGILIVDGGFPSPRILGAFANYESVTRLFELSLTNALPILLG